MKTQTEGQLKGRWGELVAAFAFPEQWVVRPLPYDFGIDLQVEVFDVLPETNRKKSGKKRAPRYTATGGHLACQVKTTESVVAKGGEVSFNCPTSDLLLAETMGASSPLLLLHVDRATRLIYYLCLTDYVPLLDGKHSTWRGQKSVKIDVPARNRINIDDPASMEEHWSYLRALAFRGKLYSFFNALGRIYAEVDFAYSSFADSIDSGFAAMRHSLERLDEKVNLAREVAASGATQRLTTKESPFFGLFTTLREWQDQIDKYEAARDSFLSSDPETMTDETFERLRCETPHEVGWSLQNLRMAATSPRLYEDFHRRVKLTAGKEFFE